MPASQRLAGIAHYAGYPTLVTACALSLLTK
jgi:hypothetical protein